MNITARTQICMVIGDPVEHSLGPQLYNALYKLLGIENEYVYVGCRVNIEAIPDFIKGVRAMGIRGVSCTVPHKREVIPYLDYVDPIAQKINAVNTIVNDEGRLKGYNTDWLGVVTPLEKRTTIKGKHVALLGAGGAARAVIYGILKRGGTVTIFNRTIEKAEQLAAEFGCTAASVDQLEMIKEMDIIFNATSVGLSPKENETPLPKKFITSRHIVFDAVYTPYETRLLQEAKEQGATIIHGTEMLLYQGIPQFAYYTNRKAPEEEMRKILLHLAKQ